MSIVEKVISQSTAGIETVLDRVEFSALVEFVGLSDKINNQSVRVSFPPSTELLWFVWLRECGILFVYSFVV